jgi:hypothetical protein
MTLIFGLTARARSTICPALEGVVNGEDQPLGALRDWRRRHFSVGRRIAGYGLDAAGLELRRQRLVGVLDDEESARCLFSVPRRRGSRTRPL